MSVILWSNDGVRVARLLSIMFEVEARPGVTAAELAETFGVSVRTVYRDVDALQQAGIPLYGTSGPHGGLRLVDGYRSRAAALGADEAAALLAGVVPGDRLAIGCVARKHQQRDADQSADDAAALAEALHSRRTVTMRYSRWEAPTEVTRTIAPLGLVLKAGTWYVMARSRRQLRTYRVDQIRSARLNSQVYEPDPSFDLAASWAAFVADFRQRLHTLDAHVRVDRPVRDWIRSEGDPALCDALDGVVMRADEHDGDIELHLPFESVERANAELLRFGTGIEVLGPPELRQTMASVVAALATRYGRTPRRRG